MDIALLSKMVGELILENDQVGLPGLGMFVADIAPASFSDRGYTVNPPFRRLIFHSYCMEDSLLVEMYSSINGVDRDTARAYLKDFLSELKMVLQDRRTLTFPGLGRLRLTNNNRYLFISDEDLDIFPDGFGLGPISMKTHVNPDEDVHIAVHSLSEAPAKTEPVTVCDTVAEEPESVPEPRQEAPVSVPEPALAVTGENVGHGLRWWLIPVIILGLLAIAMAAFVIIARINPEILYPILYSPEELTIINS